jgi:chorismate synthase
MFDGIENRLASVLFGIPAVKGVEFGNGFAAAGLRGSENNDAFLMNGDTVQTRTNRHGGILGGISSGMPLLFRVAFKPTPSIAKRQNSVSLSRLEDTELAIEGRHDPCIVPRAVPCVEAATAAVLYDMMLENNFVYK